MSSRETPSISDTPGSISRGIAMSMISNGLLMCCDRSSFERRISVAAVLEMKQSNSLSEDGI